MPTTLDRCPLAERSDAEWQRIAASFRDPDPLPGFVVIEDFLTAERASGLAAGCRVAELGLFCGRIEEDGSVESGFGDPVPDATYVTIHHRPCAPIAEAEQLRSDLLDEHLVRRFSAIAGIPLSGEARSVVTCWNPYDFIEQHTDAGEPARPNRLAISLSLARDWRPEHGGSTLFKWSGQRHAVRLTPRFNTAVLFATSHCSFHLIEQVAPDAPKQSRFTWTMLFQ